MFEIPEKWNKKTYQEYLNNLKNIAEEKYKNFHKKLVQTYTPQSSRFQHLAIVI